MRCTDVVPYGMAELNICNAASSYRLVTIYDQANNDAVQAVLGGADAMLSDN